MLYTASFLLTTCLMGDVTPATEIVDVPTTLTERTPDHWYARVDFLWWWLKQDQVPPLVTTGPAGSTGVPGDNNGVSVIYGGSMQSRHDRFIGVRPTLGYWLNDEHTFSIEASAFFLERDSSILHIKHVTKPLYQLYVDANSGQWAAEQFAGELPSGIVRNGSIQVYGRKELYGEEIHGLTLLQSGPDWKWYALAGAQFLQFRNQLNVVMTGFDEPDLNVLYGVEDNFYAYDRFYGGQIGFRWEAQRGNWLAQLTLASGLGMTEQHLRTNGRREVRTPTTDDIRLVGLHVQYSNTGDWSKYVLDAVPEVNLNLSWEIKEGMQIQFGYSLLAWMRVLRASDQLDEVNTNQILGPNYSGPGHPIIPWRDTTFWAQGLSLGLVYTW